MKISGLMRRVWGTGKAVLLKGVINTGELEEMKDAEARHHSVPSGAVFAAECHWCHPGATEQQKLGMEVAWEHLALPQPVPPWAGHPCFHTPDFHISGFVLGINPCCKMSFSSAPASPATMLGSLPLAEGQF